MRKRIVIVGGGVTGISAAGFLAGNAECILLEREQELGGYCRTIYQDGYTWDYSGHFFHFQDERVARHLQSRMNVQDLIMTKKRSRVYFRNRYINFPFQYHIHELPMEDFLTCLFDFYCASLQEATDVPSFQELLYSRYGKAISDMFLIPYTEKLYATRASQLDPDCMGRFFPHIHFHTLMHEIANRSRSPTYNDTFSYHRRGAKAYVDALASYIPKEVVRTGVNCQSIDLERRVVYADDSEYHYDHLIISIPLPEILKKTGMNNAATSFTSNKVLVLNLGFDMPSPRKDHWVYYSEPDWIFYRVGHYDNIFGEDRMSLYVEIALPSGAPVDPEVMLRRALADLRACGIVQGHTLVSWAWVVMDPAYVHITAISRRASGEARSFLASKGVFAIGRYAEWKYCSIEDNILTAHKLARQLGSEFCLGEATADVSVGT